MVSSGPVGYVRFSTSAHATSASAELGELLWMVGEALAHVSSGDESSFERLARVSALLDVP